MRRTWVDDLKPGDVILFGKRETPRVVLAVSTPKFTGGGHRRFCVDLTIQRCSWTTRPYTVYSNSDLYHFAKPDPLKRRENMRTPVRKALLASLDAIDARACPVRCWEVVGLP